jgi:hypothetical protein
MSIGIFGDENDAQTRAMATELSALGVDDVLIEAGALDAGYPVSCEDGRVVSRGHDIVDVNSSCVRSVPAASGPAMSSDGNWVLFDDWFVHHMLQQKPFQPEVFGVRARANSQNAHSATTPTQSGAFTPK